MTVAERAMSEWGWPIDKTIFGVPVTALFVLLPCVAEREGGEDGPGYADRLVAEARKHAEEVLRAEFDIIPNP